MYKKFFALAMIVFAASCTKNEMAAPSVEEPAQVNFTIGIENRLATRAISDGKGATKLVYAVFECGTGGAEDVVIIPKTELTDVAMTSGEYVISDLELLFGKTYRAIFWAQNEGCDKYTVSDDMVVTVDYSGLNNDDARDAFYASEEFTIDRINFSKNFTLRRPFAQVNVGCYKYEFEMAAKMDLNVNKSSAIIHDVPTSLDLKTKRTSGFADYEVKSTTTENPSNEPSDDTSNDPTDGGENDKEVSEGCTDVSYESASLPTAALADDDENKYLKVDLNGNGTIEPEEEFVYLSMCYILADGNTSDDKNADMADHTGRSTHEMSFTFYDDDKYVVFESGLTEVPVQRNWRTNIVGQILSSDSPLEPGVAFSIKIDPGYVENMYDNNGFYYSFTENTEIIDKDFAFNSLEELCCFGISKGHTLTMQDVNFTGTIGKMSIGIYKISIEGDHKLTNVNFNDLKINGSYGIVNNGNVICTGVGFYGTNTVDNCTVLGTAIDENSPKTSDGKYYCQGDESKVVQGTYDLCVVNQATLTINGGTYGSIYAYEQSKLFVNNSEVKTISTRAISQASASITINGGHVNRIVVLRTSIYTPVVNITGSAIIDEIVYCDGVDKSKVTIDSSVTIGKETDGTNADYIDPDFVALP